jgi:hypothetical protein
VVAQGFTSSPLCPQKTPKKVLALTACVMGGGSNRDGVEGVEVAITDGKALRGDAKLQSCNSPGPLPLLMPVSRTRASRALPYASCTVFAPDKSRSHTERMLPPAGPNEPEDV